MGTAFALLFPLPPPLFASATEATKTQYNINAAFYDSACLKAPMIFLSLYDCMPFRGMVVVFNSFEEAAPKEKQAGTRNICLLYLASILLNPSTLFPVLALFFTRESCLTPEIEAHNRKKRPSEIVSDDRKRIKFAYFAILAVFKHCCPKHANVIQLKTYACLP